MYFRKSRRWKSLRWKILKCKSISTIWAFFSLWKLRVRAAINMPQMSLITSTKKRNEPSGF